MPSTGTASKATDYVVEGLQAQPLNSIVATIKGLGFNAVRLLWSNQMVESNPVVGNYALTANPSLEGENALTIFDTVVNALTNAGIMVILDNHMSNAGWCCSTTDNNELWYNSQLSCRPTGSPTGRPWRSATRAIPGSSASDLRNEPRSPATWGGAASTDWHAAAELRRQRSAHHQSQSPHLCRRCELRGRSFRRGHLAGATECRQPARL